ncbi:non-ribosomal peptide synthetase [Nonomuraea zeae]|uniref:Amino acid adenylation domain-containing protein n=1 Tax=Nonomuraea zeae TaxID=1642303 RepID=A0A5S4GYG4_9ACTN|nr:non-ribosomal peptide synthetase [Nonomuraea zeae]TMR38025.1 amino acid adenylation domain-containing protein [Nonomuraea zeae]
MTSDAASLASVLQLYQAQLDAAPQKVAVSAGPEQLTYRELDRLANGIAAELRSLTTPGRSWVAVLAGRSIRLVAGQLGAMKAGVAFAPIDPATPVERIRAMLAGAAAVVTAPEWRSLVPGGVPVIDTPAATDAPPAPDTEHPSHPGAEHPSHPQPGDLAYVIHTSGSTGAPKGVLVPHRALANLIRWSHETFGTGGRAPLLTSPNFDPSVWEIWTYLTAGTTMVIPDERTRLSLPALRDWIVEQELTTCYAPTPIAEGLLGLSWPAGTRLATLSTGGDRLTTYPAPELPFRLINLYGPAECAVNAIAGEVPVRDGQSRPPALGSPLPGVTVRLLDEAMRPVEEGEIHLGGVCVGLGYLDRPDLTAERFVRDQDGELLYRTGDLARRRPDGLIEFLGRLDDQVKIRGNRVELGEIETVLGRHPGVRAATTAVRGHDLVAYVVGTATGQEVRAHLRRFLPDYMIPTAVVHLDELPLTGNGKVDRATLPDPVRERRSITPPATATETLLAELWQEFFAAGAIGADDDFLALGGQSLLAMRIAARAGERLGKPVEPRMLFERPALAALARAIDDLPETAPPTSPREADGLTPAQRRLWFIDQVAPGPAYNVPILYDLDGPLDTARLERAINEVVRRHPPLRTRYEEQDGEPVPVVEPAAAVRMKIVDATPRGADALARHAARDPFDLRNGPLLRALLLKLADDRHRLLVTVHHIAFDGWSAGVLLDELARLYAGESLPEPAGPYRRGQGVDGLPYWRKVLESPPERLALPADRPGSGKPARRGSRVRATLPDGLLPALEQVGRRGQASPFMVLFAAFQALLARYSGQDDIVTGVPFSGREAPGADSMIGFFVETLPIRTTLDGDPSFERLLGQVRAAVLATPSDVPLEEIVRELCPDGRPPFDVMFAMQEPPDARRGDGVTFRMLEEVENGGAKADLVLYAEGREMSLEFATDLFERATAERLLRHYVRVLEQVAADPAAPVSALLAREHEPAGHGPDQCLHRLFEQQADRTPDAVAVEFEGACLTYAELDRRANRLAHLLRGLGVGPEVPVALHVGRSLDLPVALLGILKSGGAYVPLDPSYPRGRLTQVLGRVDTPVLVTHRALAGGLPHERPVHVDTDLGGQPDHRPDSGVTPDDLAYILFTSGSTGQPKGVAMPHRPVANLMAWHSGAYRSLQFTALGFDVSVQEIFSTWAYGGTLVMVADDVRRDPAALLDHIARTRVERIFLPFVALQSLAGAGVEPPATLREVITAGEQLQVTPQLEQFVKPWMTLHNQYGPTEGAIIDIAHTLTGPPQDWPRLPPIGKPVTGIQAIILNRLGHETPDGLPGELHLGGACLARGYYGQPELTRERFVTWRDGRRLYRTGDLARRNEAGDIEFLGRADDQVKIRGYRVEPGEIAAVLAGHPAVREAFVMARDGGLVAYVVAGGPPVPPPELRAHLAERLPEYMVPGTFVALESLPVNPSGKVDRQALPEPGTVARTVTPPATPVEQAVAAIWQEVLGGEVGRHDNLFDLGGHSLNATRIASRLNEALEVRVPLRTLFAHPTVAELGAQLTSPDVEAAAELYLMVAAYSDEEAEALLRSMEGDE